MVGKYIRDQLDDLDELDEDDELDPEQDVPQDAEQLGNVVVGSKGKCISFLDLEDVMQSDAAFHNFRLQFSDFLSEFLPAYGHKLPGGKRIKFTPQQEVGNSKLTRVQTSSATRSYLTDF